MAIKRWPCANSFIVALMACCPAMATDIVSSQCCCCSFVVFTKTPVQIDPR